jgi:hypothetical protein
MSELSVRCGKAVLASGSKFHPANASAGSNRSSHGDDEMAQTIGIPCHEWVSLDFRFGSRLCKNAGRVMILLSQCRGFS